MKKESEILHGEKRFFVEMDEREWNKYVDAIPLFVDYQVTKLPYAHVLHQRGKEPLP